MERRRAPDLLATTADTYCCSIGETWNRESKLEDPPALSSKQEGLEYQGANYFKSAQWSPDGTTLLTSSADNTLRTFIVPPTLLDDSFKPLTLTPYTAHTYPTPINCLTPYPLFSLSDPTTTVYLSTPSSLPIRLSNALSPTATPLSTYPLVSPTTEAYLTPSSLLWSDPTHFVAGTESLISLFDVSRDGQAPVASMPTIPSRRHKMKGGGVGMRGIVSALSQQPSSSQSQGEDIGMLAAGTWTRWVGLYDIGGMGGTVATWSVAEAADKDAGIGGAGISQVLWSACGRYLYVVERMSNGLMVYDVRGARKLVAWIEGRQARTNQRLGVDVFEAENGMEVWAGGNDGFVKVWERVGMVEGKIEASWAWVAHEDPVTSTILHSSGTVVATSSGQRSTPADFADSDGDDDDGDDDDVDDHDSDDVVDDDSSSDAFEVDSPRSKSSKMSSSRLSDNTIRIWNLAQLSSTSSSHEVMSA